MSPTICVGSAQNVKIKKRGCTQNNDKSNWTQKRCAGKESLGRIDFDERNTCCIFCTVIIIIVRRRRCRGFFIRALLSPLRAISLPRYPKAQLAWSIRHHSSTISAIQYSLSPTIDTAVDLRVPVDSLSNPERLFLPSPSPLHFCHSPCFCGTIHHRILNPALIVDCALNHCCLSMTKKTSHHLPRFI